ncbi:MAG: discoidin domain-containing protein, partial [Oscillospiraceae bacterium]
MKKTTQKVISLLLAICLLSGLMAPAAAIVAPKAAGGDTLEILPVAPQKGPAGDFPAEDLLPTEPLLPEGDRLPEEELPQEEGLKEDPSATALVAPSLSEEIPVDGMTATTGSEEPAGNHPNEGPASNALDNNEGTIWHSLWASSPMENLWIAIDLKGTYLLDGFKYLPRQGAGGSNGLITGYKIYASTDGSTWGTAVATGTWDYGSGNSDRSQKTAAFTTPVLASHVKLVATTTVSDPGKHFAAAAELRVTGTAPVYEASFDDDAHRGGWKKDGDNASGSAAIAFTDGSGDAGFATISVNNEPAHFVGADAIPQADGFVEADITPI